MCQEWKPWSAEREANIYHAHNQVGFVYADLLARFPLMNTLMQRVLSSFAQVTFLDLQINKFAFVLRGPAGEFRLNRLIVQTVLRRIEGGCM